MSFNTKSKIFLLLAFFLFSSACSSGTTELNVGSVYSVKDKDGSFRVAKIISLDDLAVTVKLYPERYPSRPEKAEASQLSLESSHDPEGFANLRRSSFGDWQPVFLFQSTVSDQEVQDIKKWEMDHGSGFTNP